MRNFREYFEPADYPVVAADIFAREDPDEEEEDEDEEAEEDEDSDAEDDEDKGYSE
jgi:hypothetical protein